MPTGHCCRHTRWSAYKPDFRSWIRQRPFAETHNQRQSTQLPGSSGPAPQRHRNSIHQARRHLRRRNRQRSEADRWSNDEMETHFGFGRKTRDHLVGRNLKRSEHLSRGRIDITERDLGCHAETAVNDVIVPDVDIVVPRGRRCASRRRPAEPASLVCPAVSEATAPCELS